MSFKYICALDRERMEYKTKFVKFVVWENYLYIYAIKSLKFILKNYRKGNCSLEFNVKTFNPVIEKNFVVRLSNIAEIIST